MKDMLKRKKMGIYTRQPPQKLKQKGIWDISLFFLSDTLHIYQLFSKYYDSNWILWKQFESYTWNIFIINLHFFIMRFMIWIVQKSHNSPKGKVMGEFKTVTSIIDCYFLVFSFFTFVVECFEGLSTAKNPLVLKLSKPEIV